jgi:hypothetical protein
VGLYYIYLLLGACLLVCHMCVSGVSFVAPNISYKFLKSDTEFSACLPYICSPTICASYYIHATSVVYISVLCFVVLRCCSNVLVVRHAMFRLNFLNNLVIYLVSFPIYVKVTHFTFLDSCVGSSSIFTCFCLLRISVTFWWNPLTGLAA